MRASPLPPLAALLLALLGACAAAGGKQAALPAGIVDRHCRVDADCAVKNVGNCCGYYPACVNRDSPTFPEQVKAQCEAEGRMAVCGFKEISACACVAGECVDHTEAGEAGQ